MNELFRLLKADANTANAMGAIASALVALCALFVSAVSVAVSLMTMHIQRRHNVLSVRPLPELTMADYEDSLRIKIRNNGSGPMMLLSLSVSDGETSALSIIELMPELPNGRVWTKFSHALVNRSLLPGGEIILLELTETQNEAGFPTVRDIVRAMLCKLTISISYTDVYNSIHPVYTKNLSWFGRNINTL
jgi:hypothetical protein